MLDKKEPLSVQSSLVRLGVKPLEQGGYVNPPIFRGSTVLYPSVEAMLDSTSDPLRQNLPAYGRFGTPTARAFEEAMTELEGGYGAVSTSSGLTAITTALFALTQAGDHVLISEGVYGPTRNFCESLRRFGVDVEYYSPSVGSEISKLIRTNTRLTYLESPSSNTLEVQDVPAIVVACKQKGVMTLIDNTWATPLFFRPLSFGVDLVIHSASKYITGHSDSFLGVIVCNEKSYSQVRSAAIRLGQCASPDDANLGLRGLRTLHTRLSEHERQAINFANWLKPHPEVAEVLHPALSSHPQHGIWKRDFTGSTGLFTVELNSNIDKPTLYERLNSLKVFGLGYGWGGFESLVVPFEWNKKLYVRFHIGLENLEDLKADWLKK